MGAGVVGYPGMGYGAVGRYLGGHRGTGPGGPFLLFYRVLQWSVVVSVVVSVACQWSHFSSFVSFCQF